MNINCPLSYEVYKFQPEHGAFSACCDADVYSFDANLYDKLESNYFIHHPTLIERKKHLRKGVRHNDCRQCWHKEDMGMKSMRQTFGTENDPSSYIPHKAYPNRFELWMNSTCNLGCFMCNHDNSNTLRKIWYDVPDIKGNYGRSHEENILNQGYTKEYKERFLNDMIDFIIDTIENESGDLTIAYLGGEPTLHFDMYDHAEKFISASKKRNHGKLSIEIVTNGTSKDNLNARFISMIEKYKENGWVTRVMISQDSAYEYVDVRHGADFQQISKNFTNWISSSSPFDSMKSHTVLSNLNFSYIHRLTDYLKSSCVQSYNENVKLEFSFNVLTHPKWMQLNYLPKKYVTSSYETAMETFIDMKREYPKIIINEAYLKNAYDILPIQITKEDAMYLIESYKYIAKRYRDVYDGWDLFDTFPHLKQIANEYGIEI